MNRLQSEKGVTITILVVAVSILIIIAGMLMYTSNDGVKVSQITSMYNDVELLQNKVDEYYLTNGAIPILGKYDVGTIFQREDSEQQILGANDGVDFYVIDLEKLTGITLNYGRDYSEIQSNQLVTYPEYEDIYIVNEKSHNVFYVKGVSIDNQNIYHTNDLTPDTVEVEIIE